MAVAQPHFDDAGQLDDAGAARAELVARYRHLRAISREVHEKALHLVSEDAMLQQAGRLGLRGPNKRLIVENPIVMDYLCDLLLYTAHAGRSRAIDRCRRSAAFAPGSDHAQVVQAMQQARFVLLRIERPHEIAGLVATDLVRDEKLWLVDLSLEESSANSPCMATRLYAPAEFFMTAGIMVPIDPTLLTSMNGDMPRFKAKTMVDLIEDRRFAEKMYRVAFEDGVMDRVRLRTP